MALYGNVNIILKIKIFFLYSFYKSRKFRSRCPLQSIFLLTNIAVVLKETLVFHLRVVLALTFFHAFYVSLFFNQTSLTIFVAVFESTGIGIDVRLEIAVFILV